MHGWLFWVVIAALVIAVVVKRLRGEPLNAKDLLIAPMVLTGIGIVSLTKAHGLTATDFVWTGAGGVLGVALGAVRGSTITVFEKEGVLWQRYTARTFAVMVVSFAIMAGFGLIAAKAGMHEEARPTQLTLGISFLGEALAVGLRGLQTGVPFAPERKSS
ncbi:DUF1453 domain-containing protein [Streptomyces sp. UNOC14_S4]|uniref:DUF1453 domain-containing protein n=1 Tax=Streptomyces sp. UNOC14_S4 TaxID=2872340 RepID=UPI001E2FB251|nr:DUF1453 domain-containing protein [Streptomyces sp. UNOC14_S4]MCC3768442.1 DUF1453 domain-containing protein [Streptomyces sp. UNOC14_S4]